MPAPNAPGLGPDVAAVVLEHARRGLMLQSWLRLVLLAFVVLTFLAVPPERNLLPCALVVAGYAVWVGGATVWVRAGTRSAVRTAWLAQFVDLAVLAVLTLLTGVASPQSWTSDVLEVGFPLVPVLAATQLRPRICAAVVVPTVLVYLAAGIATRVANEEPWASLLLRTLLLAGVGLGCVGLSRIQRSRVRTIGALVRDRTDLLAELTDIEGRERRSLSEHLHDGALQYVLAARQDLDDARETGDEEAFARVERALAESSQLLRSTVAELHPAVLDRAGLPAALRDLARAAGARGGFAVDVDVRNWPDDERSPADALLYRTARELLTNVVKHAGAGSVTVELAHVGDRARLTVTDDGAGIPDGAIERGLRDGHIGLASHALRVEAAGGTLTLRPGRTAGTVAAVDVPSPPG
ncbi:sensor histidine kinase [Pseudonocardia zijingensis]|uniref:histidine kinase n=1 Tax=Pseudonocardia zijingensis TaxID=153376 RepID=A0ABP3YSA2_9PSEU